jgi:hypothetical protein
VSPEEVFRRITGALDRAEIPYMVTGSFASSFHGVPRATQDIDLVIAPSEDRLQKFIDMLPPDEYYLDRDTALEALRTESQFNVIDLEGGWKVDLIVRKGRAFSRVEFDRRQTTEVWGLKLAVTSLEDVILAKLEWAKLGGSERQLDDVAALLKLRSGDVDRTYLNRWIADLGVESQWTSAAQRAGLAQTGGGS